MKKIYAIFLWFSTSLVFSEAQTPTFQIPFNNSGGTLSNELFCVESDQSGNIYFCGKHTDVITFGGTTLSVGSGGAWFGKLSPGGNLEWLRQGGTPGTTDIAYGIAPDPRNNGRCYVAGSLNTSSASTFGSQTLPAGYLGFVACYDATGSALWLAGTSSAVYSIACDANGYLFINTGDAAIHKLDAGNGNDLGTITLSGSLMNPQWHNIVIHGNDVIAQGGNKILKFDNNLNQLWSTPVNASLAETFRLNLDANGDVYGTFYALFGSVTVGSVTKSNFPNGYVYRLDGATGNVLSCDSILINGAASKIKEYIPAAGSPQFYISGDGAFNTPTVLKDGPSLSDTWTKVFPSNAPVNDLEIISNNCMVAVGKHSGTSVFDSYTLNLPAGSAGIDNSYLIGLCSGTVDIPEQSDASTRAYPNPAADYIVMPGNETETITLSNALGEHFIVPAIGSNRFDLRGLPAGVYVMPRGMRFLKQ